MLSLLIQSAGGALASIGDTQEQSDLGGQIMLAGIIWQMVVMTVHISSRPGSNSNVIGRDSMSFLASTSRSYEKNTISSKVDKQQSGGSLKRGHIPYSPRMAARQGSKRLSTDVSSSATNLCAALIVAGSALWYRHIYGLRLHPIILCMLSRQSS